MVDPNTAATLRSTTSGALADAMVAAHGDLLPAAAGPLRPESDPSRDVDDVHGRSRAAQGGDVLRVGVRVGDDVATPRDVDDLGEPALADLARVGDDDDPLGSTHQRAVGVRLDLVMGGEAGRRADAVDADDRRCRG